MSRRSQRVEEAIRREASLIIKDDLKDPRIGFITVTRVTVSDDLRNASIFYTVLGGDKEKNNAEKGLASAQAFIRSEICHRLKLRFAPEIRLVQDDELERSMKIEETLRKLKNEEEGRKDGDK